MVQSKECIGCLGTPLEPNLCKYREQCNYAYSVQRVFFSGLFQLVNFNKVKKKKNHYTSDVFRKRFWGILIKRTPPPPQINHSCTTDISCTLNIQ